MNRMVCSHATPLSQVSLRRRSVRALALILFAVLPAGVIAQEPGGAPEGKDEPVRAEARLEEQVAALIKQLSARYYDDRENAREKLERIGAPAEPFLIAALKDADFRVRYYAASILGKIGSEKCLDALVAAIGDEDSSVAAAVKQALLRFGNNAREAIEMRKKACPESAEALDDLLDDFASGSVEAVLQKYLIPNGSVGFFPGMFDEIVKIGKPAVSTLLSIVTDPFHEYVDPLPAMVNPIVMRRLAVDALGDLGDKSVIPELTKIADGDIEEDYIMGTRGYLADAAAFALYKLGDTSYVDAQRAQLEQAIEALKDNAAGYRNELAILLCRIHKYEAAEEQLRLVIASNPNEFIAHYNLACIFASHGKKQEALKALEEAVKYGYTDHEWALMDGDLKSLRDDKTFDRLVQVMRARRPKTRRIIITEDGIRVELPVDELPGDEGLPPIEDEPPIEDDLPPE